LPSERTRYQTVNMASFDIDPRSIWQLLAGTFLLYAVYYFHWQLTVGANRRRMIKENGCKPIKHHPGLNSLAERLFSTRVVRENIKSFKEHKLLEAAYNRFQKYGNTFEGNLLSTKAIHTIEPDILKTMLATKFKDWNLPDRRKSAFFPLLGHGIFTTDGAAWQHSRDLLRPNFTRSQVGDLATFEDHISQLINRIPKDGSTVNLQELFFRLTIDSATEFLFGESTNSLAPNTSSETPARFAEAFNRSQEFTGEVARNGLIMKFFSKKNFNRDVKYVHDFVDRYVQRRLETRKTSDLEKANAKEEGERYVFLNELVKQTSDPIHIRSELLNILLAGRDTTASLLSNVWFILARRPDIWEKLQAEVSQLQGGLPTFAQIKEMKYLKQVLNEGKNYTPPCVINYIYILLT
jgi:cytochrome P450